MIQVKLPVSMETTTISAGAAFLHFFLALLVKNNVPPASAANPTLSSSRAVGLRGHRRFHANDSYIGMEIPCTYEEKLCFKYNTLFYPENGHCLLSDDDPCPFVGDRQKFSRGSGRLVAMCPGYEDPCSGDKYRMAYDGRCYRKQVVHEVICGCPATPTPHFLGGVECRCSPPTRIRVKQPRARGRCRVPDLRFPDFERSFLYDDPEALPDLVMQCTAQQAACFAKEMVAVRGKGNTCYRIHERGPCRRDHVVALDRRAALATPPRAEATCIHVRGGCPRNKTRLASDGKCHKDRDLRVLAFGNIDMSEDGRLSVSLREFYITSRPDPGNGSFWECTLTHNINGIPARAWDYLTPPCASNNEGLCHLYEVEADAPLPELDESGKPCSLEKCFRSK